MGNVQLHLFLPFPGSSCLFLCPCLLPPITRLPQFLNSTPSRPPTHPVVSICPSSAPMYTDHMMAHLSPPPCFKLAIFPLHSVLMQGLGSKPRPSLPLTPPLQQMMLNLLNHHWFISVLHFACNFTSDSGSITVGHGISMHLVCITAEHENGKKRIR